MAAAKQTIHAQLASAAKKGNLTRVQQLLRKGARPDVAPWTALTEAVSGGSAEVLACLIEAAPDQASRDGALKMAVMSVHRQMVQMLLDAGAQVTFDLDAPDLFEWPKHFGDTEGPEAVRRIVVSHMTAKKLESAMGDGDPQVRSSGVGMAPL